MTEMGRYMDVSVQPARKVSCGGFLHFSQCSGCYTVCVFLRVTDMCRGGGGPASQRDGAKDQRRQFLLLRFILWLFAGQL